MKLLRWAVGGASAYVIYKYSIGRKAKGEDVFDTPEKAVAKITGEPVTARKAAPRKKTAAPRTAESVSAEAGVARAETSEKPKRKRAPRKKPETA